MADIQNIIICDINIFRTDVIKNDHFSPQLPNEADATELLEKQYQEKLLQEVAKVQLY